MMKLPITIHKHGDITRFDSVEAAEGYMEAQDVGLAPAFVFGRVATGA